MLGRPGHRVDEQHQPARDRRGARDVEVTVVQRGAALANEHGREHEQEHADRDVDEEDPRPAEGARQDTAEQDACGAAGARCRAPDAERQVALASFLERRRQDRQRRRREQRRAEPLDGAKRDQRAFGPGQPVEE